MLYLIFFVLVVIAVLVFVILLQRERTETLKKIAAALQGRTTFLGQVKGAYQGFPYSVSLIPPSKNSPSQLVVRLVKPSTFSLKLYNESAMNAVGKKLRLTNEIKIHDPSFDREFLIFSNRPVQAVHFLNSSAKETLRQFFGTGFTAFSLGAEGASVRKPGYSAQDVEPGTIGEILRKLLSLAGTV